MKLFFVVVLGAVFLATQPLPGSCKLLRKHPLVSGRAQKRPLSGLSDESLPFPELPSDASEHEVTSLPGFNGKITSYAGYIPVDPVNKGALFYWYFPRDKAGSGVPNENDNADTPTVIWINGGPGCSSMYGLFMENGPLRAPDGANVQLNMHSWHRRANLLYVDQPVGTGFSFVRDPAGYADSDQSYEVEFWTFLKSFFSLYPSLLGRPLYISGESYAGHYLPSLARYILRHGSDLPEVQRSLRGVMIGNGWFDPETQHMTYSDFAFGTGLLSVGAKARLDEDNAGCAERGDCYRALDTILSVTTGAGKMVNYYDIREYFTDPDNWPALSHGTTTYLRRADVRAAIHVAPYKSKLWEACDDDVYVNLQVTQEESLLDAVAEGLAAGVRFVFFSGQFDLICNHVGVGMALRKLKWSGSEDFIEARTHAWVVAGQPAGYTTQTPNGLLTNIVFLGGSHMVLGDKVVAGLDLLDRFVSEKSFASLGRALDPVKDVESCFYDKSDSAHGDSGDGDGKGDGGNGDGDGDGDGKGGNGDGDSGGGGGGDDDDDDDDDDDGDLIDGSVAQRESEAYERSARKFRNGVTLALVVLAGVLAAIALLLYRRGRSSAPSGASPLTENGIELRSDHDASGDMVDIHDSRL